MARVRSATSRTSAFPSATWERGKTIATFEYGETFAAAAARGNVAGTQFHPEKSQKIGLQILRNFIELVEKQ